MKRQKQLKKEAMFLYVFVFVDDTAFSSTTNIKDRCGSWIADCNTGEVEMGSGLYKSQWTMSAGRSLVKDSPRDTYSYPASTAWHVTSSDSLVQLGQNRSLESMLPRCGGKLSTRSCKQCQTRHCCEFVLLPQCLILLSNSDLELPRAREAVLPRSTAWALSDIRLS